MMPGSMSPERVPMARPASGVRPIEVSIGRPLRIAAADAPLPRWRVIWCVCLGSRPSSAGTCWETNSWEVPWKP